MNCTAENLTEKEEERQDLMYVIEQAQRLSVFIMFIPGRHALMVALTWHKQSAWTLQLVGC